MNAARLADIERYAYEAAVEAMHDDPEEPENCLGFHLSVGIIDLIATLREARELAEQLAVEMADYPGQCAEYDDALAAFDAAKETW